jgi:hypothetical protein
MSTDKISVGGTEFIDFTKTQEFSDIKIESADGKIFNFNKFILFNSSDYFKKLLKGDFKEKDKNKIKLEDSGECIQILLNLICNNHIDIPSDVLSEVVGCMNKYLLSNLSKNLVLDIINNFDEYDKTLIVNIAVLYDNKTLINNILEKYRYKENYWLNLDISKLNVNVFSLDLSETTLTDLLHKMYIYCNKSKEFANQVIKIIPPNKFNNLHLYYLLGKCNHCVETSIRYKELSESFIRERYRESNKFPKNIFA